MNTTTTMTMRAFLEAVMSFPNMTDELVEKARLEIAKLDAKSEKRKTSEKAVAKAEADEALRNTMLEMMSDEFITAAEMVEKLADATVTTPKVTAMFKVLVAEGKIEEGVGKSKGRKVKAYKKAEVVE